MAACERRRRFVRGAPEHPLTEMKLAPLQWLAECGILTVPQVCGLTRKSARAVRSHMADLFHLGLVDRVAIPAVENLPLVYTLTKDGIVALVRAGSLREEILDPPELGPRSFLFLPHELEIRDVRVWLERLASAYLDHEGVRTWRHGKRAVIDLRRDRVPRQARPDAWFVYGFRSPGVVVGLVEVDRGTERGTRWWDDKFAQYGALFESGVMERLTGYKLARIVVLTPSVSRRDAIAAHLQGLLAKSALPADRFWIAERSVLLRSDLREKAWRVPERPELLPFVDDRFV